MASATRHGHTSHRQSRYGKTLQVSICEIERGVFYATYRHDDLALHIDDLPVYQVGKTAADARQQIQHSAQALGFVTIHWTGTSSAPLFPVDGDPAQPHAIADAAPRGLSNAAGE